MKICFFAQDFLIEPGASQSMVGLIEGLKNAGYEVIVILEVKGTMEPQLEKLNIKYYYCHTSALTMIADVKPRKTLDFYFKKYGSLFNVLRLSRKLKNEHIDLVHINKAVGHFGAILAKKLGVPYIWHFREFLNEDYGRQFVDKISAYRLMEQADKRIAISGAIKDYWMNELNVDFELIYNGIDDTKITFSPDLKFQRDTVRILLAGSIIEGKRQLDAVQAIALLKDKYDIKATIVGNVISEPYYKEILRSIENNELTKNITVTGFTDNLDELRKNHDIGLLCSEKEAFGRVTIETMLSGMLFIGTASGGTNELVQNNITGLLYQPGNIQELASKIDYAVCHGEEMKNIIQNAYLYAKENFTLEQTCKQVQKLYTEIKQ